MIRAIQLLLLLTFLLFQKAALAQEVTKVFTFPEQTDLSPGEFFDGNIAVYNNSMIYKHGNDLLKSDGTEAGTSLLATLPGFPSNYTTHNGLLYFTISNGTSLELWKSDGTTQGTIAINTLTNNETGTYAYGMISFGGSLYFISNADGYGYELWKYDGINLNIVTDLNTVGNGVNLNQPVAFNGYLYFSGDNGATGQELWRTNGTTISFVKDIETGAGGSSPLELIVYNNRLYFTASTSLGGRELYQSDGTAATTILLKDISAGSASSSPNKLTIYNNQLYFTAYNGTDFGLWRTTGTSSSTSKAVVLASRNSGYSTSSFKLCNGVLYFALNWSYSYSCGFNKSCTSRGRELKSFNGTTVSDIGSYSSDVSLAVDEGVTIGNKFYFVANYSYSSGSYYSSYSHTLTEVSGNTTTSLLYHSGGSNNATDNIRSKLTNYGNSLYFSASNRVNGNELWTLNPIAKVAFERGHGAAAKTTVSYNNLKLINGKLIITARRQSNAPEHQIWISNGSADDGTLIFDNGPGNSIGEWTEIDNKIYFSVQNPVHGSEPYVSDGSTAGTFMLKDLVAGTVASTPSKFSKAGTKVVFSAMNSSFGNELWVTDGTSVGTSFLKDLNTGVNSSNFFPFGQLNNNILIFKATTDTHGEEVWRTDGTSAGTYMLRDINPGAEGSSSNRFISNNGLYYFTASVPTSGSELWVTNGTAAGTLLLKDLTPGTGNSFYSNPVSINTDIVYMANDPVNGYELYKSNGTPAGTILLKDINPGIGNGVNSIYQSKVNNLIFFSGNNGSTGSELWKSDGTLTGTVMVKDIAPGVTGSNPSFLTHNGNTLYFTVTLEGVQELWRSDGTDKGTYKIMNLDNTTFTNIDANSIEKIGEHLLFRANSSSYGNELFMLNGSTGRYRLVKDINTGTASSTPSGFVRDNNNLYFIANDGAGQDLFAFRDLHKFSFNTAPVLEGIGNKVIEELNTLIFTATSTDTDIPADELTYSLHNPSTGIFPVGATITAGGVFSWTPTESQGPNTYRVIIRVTDNGVPALLHEEEIEIRVTEVNQVPVLASIGSKTISEKVELSFIVSAADADLPANTLTYSLENAPAGANINSISGAFSWTPTEAQGPGKFTFRVKVTDNGTPALSAEKEITVTVDEVNVAPMITSAPQVEITANNLYSYQMLATDEDMPANNLTYTAEILPYWLSFNASTQVLGGTPAADHVGTHQVKLSVSDGTATADQNFTITVKSAIVTSIAEFQKQQISIYPNPTSGPVTIAADLAMKKHIILQLTDLNGRKLITATGSLEAITIKLNDYLALTSAGIYVLQLVDDKKIYTTKLVKQ